MTATSSNIKGIDEMTEETKLFLCIGLMIAAVIFIVRFPWILGGWLPLPASRQRGAGMAR
jgi:hypothetical protein